MSLLVVSREIHDETVGMFYHDNRFEFYFPTQLHAFITSLGPQRLSFLRDITLHYVKVKNGGIDLADLTFPLLKQLTGLRRLHIILESNGRSWWREMRHNRVDKSNPCEIPGLKVLFDLRGVTDIKVCDPQLERRIQNTTKSPEWPNVEKFTKDWDYIELERILHTFNIAIANAQKGKVCRKMLDDKDWYLKEDFSLDVEED